MALQVTHYFQRKHLFNEDNVIVMVIKRQACDIGNAFMNRSPIPSHPISTLMMTMKD